MIKYVIKRLLITIPVLLGVCFIVFTILSFTPGDPGRLILGENATQEEVDALNHEFGVDQPFFTRFFNYIKDIVTKFDFGKSYLTQEPVIDGILSRFPITFRLALLSICFTCLLGCSLGVLSAVKQYSLVDNISTVGALFFAAIPGFWLALMLLYVFALKLGWLPSYGVDSWTGYILPVVCMSLTGAAGLLRLTRSTMLETIRMDYVRTARAKGAGEARVVFVHALRNALMPVVTSLGMTFGALLGGTIVTESVFAIPGLGTHILSAIRKKDFPVVMGGTLFLAALFCIIMLIVDLVYAYLDPRVKAKYTK